jgi:hypothetical protein
MRKLFLFFVSSAWLGCASSPAPAPEPSRPSGSVPAVAEEANPPSKPNAFTSREDCEKLVDHIDSITFLSGHEHDAFKAPNQNPNWHQSRVDECTITVDKHDRQCLFGSHDLNTASHCNSRFFADTMAAYRFQ